MPKLWAKYGLAVGNDSKCFFKQKQIWKNPNDTHAPLPLMAEVMKNFHIFLDYLPNDDD